MAKRRKNKKNTFLIFIVFVILVIFGVLIINSIMDGELLKKLKMADEKKANEQKQIETEIIEEDNEKNVEETENKEDEVFVKKEDDTSFKLVDKTIDDEDLVETPVTEESKKLEKERENLAIQVVKNEWYGGEEPKNPKEYFSIIRKKSENVFIVEVRDKVTTRLKSEYEVNVLKREIVNRI